MATAPRLRTACGERGAEGTWGRVGPGSPGHGPALGQRGSSPPPRPVPSPRDRVGKDLGVQPHPRMCRLGGPRGEAAKPPDLHRLLTGPTFPESRGVRLGAGPVRVGELGNSPSRGGWSGSRTRQGERCQQPQVEPAHHGQRHPAQLENGVWTQRMTVRKPRGLRSRDLIPPRGQTPSKWAQNLA